MELYFSNFINSLSRGLTFFVTCFGELFNVAGSPFAFIPFILVVLACLGSLTAILGLIGNGISMTHKASKD